MKIAIWLDSEYRPEEGGGFSYYDKLVRAIDAYCFSSELDVCFVSNGDITALPLKREKYQLCYKSNLTFVEKVKAHIPLYKDFYKPILQNQKNLEKNRSYIEQLQTLGIDVIYYLRQSECLVPNFPFVATNWDIGHSSTYAFPELVMDEEFERRSHFYTNLLPKALFVFAESESGKQELIRYTNIADFKIKVVPIFAGNCINEIVSKEEQMAVLRRYGLKDNRYFFYPAQFWAHKNHANLIKAFKSFLHKYPDFKLILTGSDKGNYAYIQELVKRLNVTEQVVFAGFVDNAVINTFFLNATALCMASFFGPTNMPPIEAMSIGCPVICSDLSGHREILGDAALYFDAQNVPSIAECMELILNRRDEYIAKINKQAILSKFTIDEALARINTYMLELVAIRSAWN